MDLVQVAPPQSVPSNASLPGLVTPARVEQTRSSGVRPSSANGVTQADEDYEVAEQNERADIETSRVNRQYKASEDSSRGSKLDILV